MKKDKNIKKICQQLGYSLGVSIFFALLFGGPLKGLTKFIMIETLTNSYCWTIVVVLFIIFSGLISFVIAKSIQYLKGNGTDMNISEFIYIFTLSIACATLVIILGYPLLACFLGGGIDSAVHFFYYLNEECKVRIELPRGAEVIRSQGEYKSIFDSLKADNQGTTGNSAENQNVDSDTSSTRSVNSTSSSESERLNRSLTKVERKMELVQSQITIIEDSIERNTILHNRYRICSKVLSYIPKHGNSLYDVFYEASLGHKETVLRNREKLLESQGRFNELRDKRLGILDRLEGGDQQNYN